MYMPNHSYNANALPAIEDEDVVAYIQGDLSSEEQMEFEAAMATSELLKLRVYETQRLVQQLQETPCPKLSHDVSGNVIQAIRESQRKQKRIPPAIPFPGRILLKVAACAVALAGGFALLMPHMPAQRKSPSSIAAHYGYQHAFKNAIDWLARTQEPSGYWDGRKWGARKQDSISLTGLALLALVQSRATTGSPQYEPQIKRAMDYLLQQQQANGCFGNPRRDGSYAHAIALCALLETHDRYPSEHLQNSLASALGYLHAAHIAASGWNYGQDNEPGSQSTDAFWRSRALALANRSQFQAKNKDYYRWYFDVAKSGTLCDKNPQVKLRNLQQRILETQEQNGQYAGSWKEPGTSGSAGGRVYTTAMAALALGVES